VIYAFILTLIQQTHAPFSGYAPGLPHNLLRGIFAVLALAGFGFARFLQRSILEKTAAPAPGLTTAAVVALALCEAVALYGFVLFLLTGRASDYYLFAAVSVVGFARYFPRREVWEEQARAIARRATGPAIRPPGA
jgi:F0F1-type ATP synthase membrane subunit c/vacuolar-type H+-ATPase subunit K